MSYTQAVVTFVDILGFGSLVTSGDASKIEGVLNAIRQEVPPNFGDSELSTMANQRFTNFSDCCVRSTPLVRRDGTINDWDILFHEIIELVHAQANLIRKQEVFLRGAITFGEIDHRDDMVFGPALVRAYYLESKVADSPRIVIDPDLVHAYRTGKVPVPFGHERSQDAKDLERLLKRSDDGVYFVDYLSVWASEVDEPSYYVKFLEHHRDTVNAGLKKSSSRPDVAKKYSWLARYHNTTINGLSAERLKEFGVKKSQLLLSDHEDTFFQALSPK